MAKEATFKELAKDVLDMVIGESPIPSEEVSAKINADIAEKGKDGLAQMIGLKKTSSINIGPLIVLSNKDDYNKLIQSMSIANNNVLF